MTLRLVSSIAVLGMVLGFAGASLAEAPLQDPNLQSVKPDALRQLSETRIRQEIMQDSQARYVGRCICAQQSQDSKGRSCKGRHEVVKTRPAPLCYPTQVSKQMIRDWRKRHS